MTDTPFRHGISVLIPVYNYDCTLYVRGLVAQLEALMAEEADRGMGYEVLLLDDASTDTETLHANRALNRLPHTQYIEATTNRGRALGLNLLLDRAQYQYVLVTDADAAIVSPHYLSTYWDHRTEAPVLVGGLTSAIPELAGHELRYRYEKHAEEERRRRFAHTRRVDADAVYHHFSTFNLWMDRRVTASYRFDERCEEYGYEDALFGLTLRERGVPARYIDNPLAHLGIDSNRSFLEKTEASLRTLSRLTGLMQASAGTSRLWQRLCGMGMGSLVAALFNRVKPLMQRQLYGRKPSLIVFQLYKLGYYAALMKAKRQGSNQK